MDRVKNQAFRESLTSGRHNAPLNAFLARTAAAVRRVYHGPITYASLPFETVDWGPFDIVGVDHYRAGPAKEQYVEMLEPLFATGKPVVNTEFGMGTYVGADEKGMLANLGGMVDVKTLFAHAVPLVGRLVRPRLNGRYVRDEEFQARELTETLAILDGAGVDGAFVATFLHAINPYDEDPLYDLDMSVSTLVKTLTAGKHGTTYPDMTWEPKASFRAVAPITAPRDSYPARGTHCSQPASSHPSRSGTFTSSVRLVSYRVDRGPSVVGSRQLKRRRRLSW